MIIRIKKDSYDKMNMLIEIMINDNGNVDGNDEDDTEDTAATTNDNYHIKDKTMIEIVTMII